MVDLPLRAISIRQPWAWLIVNGIKDVENRNWRTHYRGPVLVHAGLKIDLDAYGYVEEFVSENLYIPPPEELECGGIVGVTSIIDCKNTPCGSPWHRKGSHGFILRESKPLPFMPLKGKLNFFKVDYSPLKIEAP